MFFLLTFFAFSLFPHYNWCGIYSLIRQCYMPSSWIYDQKTNYQSKMWLGVQEAWPIILRRTGVKLQSSCRPWYVDGKVWMLPVYTPFIKRTFWGVIIRLTLDKRDKYYSSELVMRNTLVYLSSLITMVLTFIDFSSHITTD